MFRPIYAGLVLLASLPCLAQGDHPANNRSVIVTDVNISGVRTIGTDELSAIASALTGKAITEDDEEISDRLKFSFQNHGYFAVKVNSIKVRTSDVLARPKPVTIEAVVEEGPLFHVGEVKFSGNRAYSTDDLRAQFPVKKGDVFTRSRIAGGLEAIRILYAKIGYIDFTPLPNTEVAADTVNLTVDIDEGKQYRLGSLEFVGSATLADKLRSRWELELGNPFDGTYLEKFIEQNRSLFSVAFDPDNAIKVGRNCKSASVTLLIDLDPQHPTQRQPEYVPCGSRDGANQK